MTTVFDVITCTGRLSVIAPPLAVDALIQFDRLAAEAREERERLGLPPIPVRQPKPTKTRRTRR